MELSCSSCSVEECAAPGACSAETACDLVGCNSVLIDEDACFRPACSTDAECSTDTRCTASYWGQRVDCAETAGTCGCTTGQGLRVRSVCSPTALAGPRGTWQTITVEEEVYEGDAYVKTWAIAADARVDVIQSSPVAEYEPYVAQLSADDLDRLVFMINGAELRLLLGDDTPCRGALDYRVTIMLGLDTGSIEKEVTDCTVAGEDTARAPLPDLLALARRY
jgi:hypothetical protein